MKKKLAFVLGGGGSRGAMQVGALRALFESGYQPDLVTATSIGAANAAFLAVNGFTAHGIDQLSRVWETTVNQDMLPTNLWHQTMRTFFGRTKGFSQQRIRKFAIDNGLTPELRFKDLHGVRFYPVAADLNTGCPVIFGLDPEESVLESVLASMSLPPWMFPVENNGRYLMDGGAVSNLPVEAAIMNGATAIIALDLFDPDEYKSNASHGLSDFLLKLDRTVEGRETILEIKLAEARGIQVRRIQLISPEYIPLWDFRHSVALIQYGYELTCQTINSWADNGYASWWRKPRVKTFLEDLFTVLE